MRVALVGGTGVLGRHVLARLLAGGIEVRVLRRSEDAPESSGVLAESIVGDLLNPGSLSPLLRGCDAAIHVATALRVEAGATMPDWTRNDAVRDTGTANLIEACCREGVGQLVAQSVAFVASALPDGWSSGTESLASISFLRSATLMEQRLRSAPFACVVLRGGLFYGHGTGTQAQWKRAAQDGTLALPRRPLDYVSLIHVDDMAAAVVASLGSRVEGCYPVVDDEPVRWQDLLVEVAAHFGAPPPSYGDWESLPSFRVCNRNTKHRLPWQPRFKNYREGLGAPCPPYSPGRLD